MGCRRNQATLSAAEKAAFVNAVIRLKTVVPSRLHPGDPNRHRYDDYVEVHMNAMMRMDGSFRDPGWAHRGPAFLPWHRELLRQFEADLQAIDYTVTLPYWDWTVDQSPDPVAGSPWTNDFMGAMDPTTDRVTSGPFRDGSWVKVVFDPGCSDDNTPYLRRALGRAAFQTDPCGLPNVAALPSAAEVTGALGETPYDVAPWGAGVSPSFRDRLEGWHGLGSIHNRVHLWVGGSMLPSTSPNDPIFFLHHCNVDRLWSVWQQQHPTEGYHPTGSGPEVGPPGHNLTDVMIFNDPMQPAPWPVTTTVAMMLNSHLPPSTYWYDTDPPEVTLLTPSVSFVDIPEGVGGTGVTTYRAVRFDVMSCAGVTFQITAGPTAPFTAPLGNTVTVPPAHQAPPAAGRVWIAYTSTTAGTSVTGSVTIHCVETNQDFIISLSANTVARPKSAMALVLDRSGSMSEDAGDGHPKVDKLKQAVSAFVAVMLPGDGLSIVRFDDTAQRLMSVTDVGPVSPVMPGSGRDLANQILASTQLDPAGATSIGGGVQEGKLALDTAPMTVPPYSVKAMLVVTDGEENTPPMIADVQGSLTANTFAIGLGTPANISVPALQALTQGHNGYLVVTGTITPDQSFRLTKYFLQALAGITNAQVVLDPQGELVFGTVHRIPFRLVEPDMGVDVVLLCPGAGLVDFALETPDGRTVTPALVGVEPAVQFYRRADLAFYRLALPALQSAPQGARAGQWKALLALRGVEGGGPPVRQSDAPRRALPYNLLVHAYSTLRLEARLNQQSYEPGARVQVNAVLTEYDVPVEKRAIVWAEVTRPDRFVARVPLIEGEGGLFEGDFVARSAGLYTVRVRATGATFSGCAFEREQTLSASAVPGADRRPDPGLLGWLKARDERLCRLLACLLRDHGLLCKLEKSGIDVEHLRACLETYCRSPERPRQYEDEVPAVSRGELRRLVELITAEAAAAPSATIATLPHARPVMPRIQTEVTPARATIPRFGLSPEDLAAGERAPQPRATVARPAAVHEPRPVHGLSPEDEAADRGPRDKKR